jgi:hypothetical protein
VVSPPALAEEVLQDNDTLLTKAVGEEEVKQFVLIFTSCCLDEVQFSTPVVIEDTGAMAGTTRKIWVEKVLQAALSS